MKIAAVAFDVDGTFYSNSEMYLHSIPWAVRNWRLLRAFSHARIALRKIRPITDFAGLQARLTAERLKRDEAETQRLIVERVYTDWELSLRGVRIFPGLSETLGEFRERGLKLGVLSDFPVERKLALLGIADFFDFALSTEDIGYLKPNPEGFRCLADGLGVDASEILYVGNSHRYDIVGAKGVGMHAAHLTKKPPKPSEADYSFSSYNDLKRWVLKNS